MRNCNALYINERPAYMQIVNNEQNCVRLNNGYTLQIDFEHLSASIINLKKGGKHSMIKSVKQVKQGYEKIYEDIVEYEQNLEERVRQQMADDFNRVKAIKEQCVEIVEVEVPDEEVSVEDTDNTVNV